jgi:hypothetical protein
VGSKGDRFLYGSDFPYCTAEAEYNKDQLKQYEMDSQRLEAAYLKNALELFPRLKQFYG